MWRSNLLVQVFVPRELDAAHINVPQQPLIRKVIQRDAVLETRRCTGGLAARCPLGAALKVPFPVEKLLVVRRVSKSSTNL